MNLFQTKSIEILKKIKRHILPLLIILAIGGIAILPSTTITKPFFIDEIAGFAEMNSVPSKALQLITPDSNSGRYSPLSGISILLTYYIAGDSVQGFYIVQSIIFLGSSMLIYYFIYKLTSSKLLGTFATALILSGGPIGEIVYTMKAESKLLPLLVIIFILVFAASKTSTKRSKLLTSFIIGFLSLI